MKRFISYFLRGFFGLLAVFFLLWGVFWAILSLNKNKIISKVRLQLSQQMKGELSVGDLKADFIHEFPYLAVQVSNVRLRDSSANTHNPDFINAEKIYVRLKPLSLLSLNPRAGRITVENSTIYFYSDSAGRSNIVRRDSAKTNAKAEIPDLLFINTRFVQQDISKQKLFDIYCEKLKCDVDQNEMKKDFKIKLKCIVHSLAFNTAKGSYLKNKEVEGKFRLTLNDNKELSFNNIDLTVDKHNIHCTGKFFFTEHPTFELAIRANNVKYETGLSFLPDSIQQRLKIYNTDRPMSLEVNLKGSLEHGKIPLTTVNAEQKKTNIRTPVANFNQCSFAAFFTNQLDPGQPESDQNSRVTFTKFSGEWENVKLRSDSILITNLIKPVLNCDVKSEFDLKQLNELTGSNTIHFTDGKGDLNVRYLCSLVKNDSVMTSLVGTVGLKNAELSYLPRQFSLTKCNGTIAFEKQNVFIRKLSAHIGSNQLQMNGSVENLLTLLNTSPESLTIKWNISSPDLDINNFISYIGKRATVVENNSKKKFFNIADKIDRMLKDGAANVQIQATQVRYKKFKAQNVFASLSLLQNKILLNEARLKHAGGSISFHGSLLEDGGINNLQFFAALDHLNIPEVFYSFDNFGQDAITDKNMKGQVSANIDMWVGLTDKALIVPNSLKGNIDFLVENGELINFEPVQKISETAFKKRNFAELHFAELKNKLEINGSAIKIPNMEIHSSALTMFVQGIYDTKNGTDMSIQLPISNLKKSDPTAILKNKNKPGLSLRLRAHTGEDGKLKVTWDPFNKASKSLSVTQLQQLQQ